MLLVPIGSFLRVILCLFKISDEFPPEYNPKSLLV